ncbi:MAG TPA: lysylphosphatidylglycerol synthase domain-containing protein [Candidatus Dormibacteraeota bacterium]|nr:lysylphosphatidylglycerol synthase domain-containing protein [Candidatus Dormibacteraeota bacterium]
MIPEVERTGPNARETGRARWALGHPGLLPRLAGRLLPILIALAALVGLVLVVHPRALAGALARFNPLAIPVVIVLTGGWFVLQGYRWHFLLRAAGSTLRAGDSVLLSVAGQVVTALLPLGDLTRAVFATEAAGLGVGAAAATVTVQELTFTLLLLLLAAPGMLALHAGTGVVLAVIVAVLAIFAILTVPQLFRLVRGGAALLPLPRRLLAQVDELQREASHLLRRRSTLAWSVVDLARAVLGASVLWLIVQVLDPGAIGWWTAAFVVAVAYVGGAISFLPGGTGANDASVVGLLILLGLDGGTAAAAALLQRVCFTGLAASLGLTSYLLARRRFRLGGLLTHA